jgi:hypothetical protein
MQTLRTTTHRIALPVAFSMFLLAAATAVSQAQTANFAATAAPSPAADASTAAGSYANVQH